MIEEKYAKLWHETCGWEVPAGLEPFKKLSEPEQEIYVYGMWKILNEMFEDGLISQDTLRRMHEEENGWERGQSKISRGNT